MNNFVNNWPVLLALSFLLVPPNESRAQEAKEQGEDREALLNGRWRGTWTSLAPESSGYVYFADLRLQIDGKNTVEGHITFTLKKTSPSSQLAKKIGSKALEFVKGKYNPVSRMLTLNGYKKNDPRIIIALDSYRLTLAEDNKNISGVTRTHQGTWQGRISLDFHQTVPGDLSDYSQLTSATSEEAPIGAPVTKGKSEVDEWINLIMGIIAWGCVLIGTVVGVCVGASWHFGIEGDGAKVGCASLLGVVGAAIGLAIGIVIAALLFFLVVVLGFSLIAAVVVAALAPPAVCCCCKK